MPIYEYRCKSCGAEVEMWQKITDKPAKTCPECGRRTLERLISSSSFHLKGSGWYVTDYGKSGSAGSKRGSNSESQSGSESSSGESKSGNSSNS